MVLCAGFSNRKKEHTYMAAPADITTLPKAQQKIARSYAGKLTRRVREQVKTEQVTNAALGLGGGVVAAVIDHKFRKGADAEARLGAPDATFRPQVNALVSVAALGVGVFGLLGKHSGSAIAAGVGVGSPALYAFTRNQLAKM
jgi:hypothetical protein